MSDGRSLETLITRHSGRVEHGAAWLRLAAVGLFAAAEPLPPPGDYNVPFFTVLGVYALWSLGLLALVRRRSLGPREGLVASGVDLLVITALSSLSGGEFSLTGLGYFFVPVTVAFRYRPALTLAVTAAAVSLYVLMPVLDIGPDYGDVAGYTALWAGMIGWVGLACTVLSATVARRNQEVARLAADREQLLTEALAAESRERQALADGLHDGAVQSLLAARHDVEEAAASEPAQGALDRADEAILGVVRQLREAIFELHPHVLEEAGLEAAIRQVAETAARRAGFKVTLELDELERARNDRMVFSVFRELIRNVSKHSGASHVTVRLEQRGDERILTVRDDGTGFDPAVLPQALARGHVGLASQRVRIETIGGQLELSSAHDHGTTAVARIPI